MRQAARWGLLAAMVPGLLGALPARAQVDTREGIYLQNQILDLRRQLDAMRNGGGLPAPVPLAPVARGGAGASGDLVASLLERVQALEEEVRDLRGQVEATRNAQDASNADLSKQIGDLNFRLQSLEGGRSAAALPPQSAPAAQPAAAAAPVRRTPEVALQEGYAALARHDYKAAEATARDVRKDVGPRNANANFLLAQAMAGQRNWPAAAVAFNDTYDAARSGTHAQDSLLGLANSLVALGDNRAACDALAKLNREFPKPRPDLQDSILATRTRAGCR